MGLGFSSPITYIQSNIAPISFSSGEILDTSSRKSMWDLIVVKHDFPASIIFYIFETSSAPSSAEITIQQDAHSLG
jgi:hypothetical protein